MHNSELLYFADICAGPGGFSEYIMWRKKWRVRRLERHANVNNSRGARCSARPGWAPGGGDHLHFQTVGLGHRPLFNPPLPPSGRRRLQYQPC